MTTQKKGFRKEKSDRASKKHEEIQYVAILEGDHYTIRQIEKEIGETALKEPKGYFHFCD